MATGDLKARFEVFDLPLYSTLHDLDQRYHQLSLDLHKRKASDPDLVCEQQKHLDDTYYVLLQYFISRDCEEGKRSRKWDLSFANVEFQRYEKGIRRKSPNDDNTVEVSRQFRDEIVQQARKGTLLDDNDDEEEQDQRTDNDDFDNDDLDDDDVVVVGTRKSDGSTQPYSAYRPKIFELLETEGDIFDAPDNAVIVHAVNCLGVWGSGFAAVLKTKFPAAFNAYSQVCRSTKPRSELIGNCLLIPPRDTDYNGHGKHQPRRWIACLFTSVGYGSSSSYGANPGKDDEDTILMHTDSALLDLRSDLAKQSNIAHGRRPGDLYSPKFNAGNFGVSWKHTEKLIAACFAGYSGTWNVITAPERSHWGFDATGRG